MWSTIDRFARPALARHLHDMALALNVRARALLERAPRTPGDCRALADLLTASAACWRLFRRGLPAPRRRLLRRHLTREAAFVAALRPGDAPFPGVLPALARHARSGPQKRALSRLRHRLDATSAAGPGAGRGRALARLLEAEAAWLDDLDREPPASDADLQAGLAHLYRKARDGVLSRPGAAGSRRCLSRLVRVEELIFTVPGLTSGAAGSRDRRRLLEMLAEDAWLAALGDSGAAAAAKPKDRKRLARLVRRRRRELACDIRVVVLLAFDETAAAYRQKLPWRIFASLVPMPVAGRIEGPGAFGGG